MNFSANDTVVTYAVIYKGTSYKKGMLVVCSYDGESFTFGKIILILSSENVYFVVQKCRSVRLANLGLFQIFEDSDVICTCATSLADYYPLQLYKTPACSVVTLHHSVCC